MHLCKGFYKVQTFYQKLKRIYTKQTKRCSPTALRYKEIIMMHNCSPLSLPIPWSMNYSKWLCWLLKVVTISDRIISYWIFRISDSILPVYVFLLDNHRNAIVWILKHIIESQSFAMFYLCNLGLLLIKICYYQLV